MKVEQANAIPLVEILERIYSLPDDFDEKYFWYYSPFRHEDRPTLRIDTEQNLWNDIGLNKGGNVIDFVRTYLANHKECHTPVDALRWLSNMMPAAHFKGLFRDDTVDMGKSYSIDNVKPLEGMAFIHWLDAKGIAQSIARKHLKEICLLNKETDNKIHAIGLENESKGYELHSKFIKGWISAKDISFVRGAKPFHTKLHVFKDVIDFITALHYQKGNAFEEDVIVLNSYTCLSFAAPYIKHYSYEKIYTWFDNEDEGGKATEAVKEFAGTVPRLQHFPMNKIYEGYNSVNEWHMKKLGLMP